MKEEITKQLETVLNSSKTLNYQPNLMNLSLAKKEIQIKSNVILGMLLKLEIIKQLVKSLEKIMIGKTVWIKQIKKVHNYLTNT